MQDSLLWQWLKDEFLPVAKSCTWKRVISSCLQKDAFQNMDFSRLKCQLKRKKKNWHSLFVKIFQVSADEGMGK